MKPWNASESRQGSPTEFWLISIARKTRRWLMRLLRLDNAAKLARGRSGVPRADQNINATPAHANDSRWDSLTLPGPPEDWLSRVREGAPGLLLPPEQGGIPEFRAQAADMQQPQSQHNAFSTSKSTPRPGRVTPDSELNSDHPSEFGSKRAAPPTVWDKPVFGPPDRVHGQEAMDERSLRTTSLDSDLASLEQSIKAGAGIHAPSPELRQTESRKQTVRRRPRLIQAVKSMLHALGINEESNRSVPDSVGRTASAASSHAAVKAEKSATVEQSTKHANSIDSSNSRAIPRDNAQDISALNRQPEQTLNVVTVAGQRLRKLLSTQLSHSAREMRESRQEWPDFRSVPASSERWAVSATVPNQASKRSSNVVSRQQSSSASAGAALPWSRNLDVNVGQAQPAVPPYQDPWPELPELKSCAPALDMRQVLRTEERLRTLDFEQRGGG